MAISLKNSQIAHILAKKGAIIRNLRSRVIVFLNVNGEFIRREFEKRNIEMGRRGKKRIVTKWFDTSTNQVFNSLNEALSSLLSLLD